MAREVHDELGQMMTALRLQISIAQMQQNNDPSALAENLTHMKSLVDSSIDSIRRVSRQLRPVPLEMGLLSAVNTLTSDFRQHSSIACEISATAAARLVNGAVALASYRVIQESLTNVLRHAQASRVRIHLRVQNHKLTVEVSDDGIGFDSAAASTGPTLGLKGMQERVRALQGTLKVESLVGHGTRVLLQIPMSRPGSINTETTQ